jgi:aldehyde dehydrogenase (NAD+)
LCMTRREAVGVCGMVIPWNFPILMFAWKAAPALACGCTFVMKSSEKTPLTALRLGELFVEAGFPAGVVNVLSGFGPTAGEAISRHPDIDKVAFTGSTGVGHAIMKAAAESNLKRVSLELGGKSPLIVCADADLKKAAKVAQLGIFLNSGQCCIASSRVYCAAAVYDEFVAECKALATSGAGNWEDQPLVDKIQFDKVLGYLETGKAEGATLTCGGQKSGDKGYFVQPTIFSNVTDNMKIAHEEIFGPVISILKFDELEDAIARCNNTKFGLGAGVMTRDVGRALAVSRKLRAGTVYVNCWNYFDSAAPFGGFKESGHGRDLGEAALDNYTESKTILIPID